MSNESLLTDVCSRFFSTLKKDDIMTHVERFMDAAKRLIAIYADLNRLEESEDQLIDMLDGYQARVISYLETMDLLQQRRATSEVPTMYDEMLMIYSLLFSVYERFYGAILQKSFRTFILCKGFLSEKYGELSVSSNQELGRLTLGDILSREMIFDSYDFPLALRMLVATPNELQSICGSSLQVRSEELEAETKKFADRLIYLTGVRNQIAHMSNKLEYYSREKTKLRRNFIELAFFFPTIQFDMYRLFDIFHSMSKTLLAEGKLQEKAPDGREKVLEEILPRLPVEERCESCRQMIRKAREKARNRRLSAKELFR